MQGNGKLLNNKLVQYGDRKDADILTTVAIFVTYADYKMGTQVLFNNRIYIYICIHTYYI